MGTPTTMFYFSFISHVRVAVFFQRVKNPEITETLKQFVSEFHFSFISHLRAFKIKCFVSVLFQFYFMLCEPLKAMSNIPCRRRYLLIVSLEV